MNDVGVIDTFLDVFSRYIDSGFGLVGGKVGRLADLLLAIDLTLAALFWSLASGEDILARLIRKTLYVGFFAYLIGNFPLLADLLFRSFAQLGLEAGGGAMSAETLLRPGRVAAAGVSAGKPLLDWAAELGGFPEVFNNIIPILLFLGAFGVVVLAFFVMAVQLFVVLIEFKLTTLAGFVLVPFGLLGHTAFLAERVLGAVVASGVKVLVLGVITGIGAGLFDQFAISFTREPSLEEVLAIGIASLTLAGLSLFGPGVAAGLVSGAPQLGAGAAAATGAAVAGVDIAGAAGLGALRGAKAGAAVGAGRGAGRAGAAETPAGTAPAAAPAWATRMQRRQQAAQGASLVTHAAQSGDQGGGSASVSLKEDKS